MSDPNIYAAGGLDRSAARRQDSAWIAERLAAPESRFLAVWRSQNLIAEAEEPAPLLLPPEAVEAWRREGGTLVFLGLADGVAHFAVGLAGAEPPALDRAGRFADLRSVGPLLGRGDAALLAYARALVHWHERHRFCGVCGSPTEVLQAGHQRRCSDAECGALHFPRTDPAVIMLVSDGERVLLGRQRVWPPGMHSVLAGFVEPGESLEDAVRREVMEEVGVPVDTVRYHSSQPWPFPASIMLGFTARALATELRLDQEEIESARWFSREELRRSPEDESFRLPRRDSIARRLLEDWLAES